MPAYIGLFLSADGDPLFLQVKLAVPSVLEPHVSITDPFPEAGERRRGPAPDAGEQRPAARLRRGGRPTLLRAATARHDVSADLTAMNRKQLTRYAEACGHAHAHARTGDRR
jgi:hypothetical protein